MLQDMYDKNDAWFNKMLQNATLEPDAAIDLILDETDPANELDVGAAVPALMDFDAIAPLFVQPKGFSRQLVDLGEGTQQLKIYFDHFSGGAGISTFAASHACIRRSRLRCCEMLDGRIPSAREFTSVR